MSAWQLLSHRILLIAMRDVGLHVWETDSIISASKRDYILITAPLSTLAARAEMLQMKVRVKPKSNGMFQVCAAAVCSLPDHDAHEHAWCVVLAPAEPVRWLPASRSPQGNFAKHNFMRGGPMQAYRVATRKAPHPYPDYYDDFTLLQRLQLVMDLVARPRVVGHSVRYALHGANGGCCPCLTSCASPLVAFTWPGAEGRG